METYSYNECYNASLEYFNNDQLAAKVFSEKYALRDRENNIYELTPSDMHRRIAKEFARVEKDKFKDPLSEDEIFDLLDKFKYIIPQGSPLFGIGNPYQYVTLSNCYVLSPLKDSYSSILDIDKELVNICKRRGGTGIDISSLRPSGTPVSNSARTSTGIVPFMERFSNSTREVGQGNRRGALMITIDIRHPEVAKFATIKKDRTKVTGANISIKLRDDFLEAVKKNKKYTLRFPVDSTIQDAVYREEVDARDLWHMIIENARDSAEPGLLFWDRILEQSPADCYEDYKTISTNPCSELPLSALDSCRLMLINLVSFVDNPYTPDATFNYKKFKKYSMYLQRLMDDMVDLETEATERIINKLKQDYQKEQDESLLSEIEMWKKIRKNCLNGRRTGSGITGLGDLFASLNMKYASDKCVNFADDLFKTFKLSCYRQSVEMAKEIGPFKAWDYEKEKDHPYLNRIKEEDPDLYADMSKYGRRNISLLTIAPAGSISILTQTTSGVEPAFLLSYTRKTKISDSSQEVEVDSVDQSGDKWKEHTVYHHELKKWMEVTGETDEKKSPWWGCCAEELNWKERVKLQGTIQKHIDHSISSTLNLPEDVTTEKVKEIYETAWESNSCKGVTVYRKNCRSGVLVDSKAPEKQNKIIKTTAPKRPKEVPCDVFHIVHKKQKYYAAVGLLNEDPYEVFIGVNSDNNGDPIIPRSIKYGCIVKNGRGNYLLRHITQKNPDNPKTFELNILDGEREETLETLTRLCSMSLRHGADISFIVHQLEKIPGTFNAFTKVIAKTLKKYIKDGTQVYGENCPECKSSLVRQEGCIMCKNCGFSKCG